LAVDGKQEPSEWDDRWTLSTCRHWTREEVEGRKIDADWIEKIEGEKGSACLTFKETRSEKDDGIMLSRSGLDGLDGLDEALAALWVKAASGFYKQMLEWSRTFLVSIQMEIMMSNLPKKCGSNLETVPAVLFVYRKARPQKGEEGRGNKEVNLPVNQKFLSPNSTRYRVPRTSIRSNGFLGGRTRCILLQESGE
jgi:hypothetical protein